MTETERETVRRLYTPAVDIIKRQDDIEIVADLPGVDEKSLDVTVEKNVLTIYGKVAEEGPEDVKLTASEYGVGDYKRVFTISDEIDPGRIRAALQNGVLRVTLPKAEEVKSRKVQVTTAE
jgi:HSP20 family molecular chaperone IbpA